MAATTVQIVGKILKPDGQPADGGEIVLTLSEYGTTDDAGTEQVVAKTKRVVIAADGSVDFNLIPNSVINTASGSSFYTAAFQLLDGDAWVVRWQLVSSPATQDIGDVPIVTPAPGDPPWLLDAKPAASAAWRGRRIVVKGAEPPSETEDVEYVCLKQAADPTTYDWIPTANGGGPSW